MQKFKLWKLKVRLLSIREDLSTLYTRIALFKALGACNTQEGE